MKEKQKDDKNKGCKDFASRVFPDKKTLKKQPLDDITKMIVTPGAKPPAMPRSSGVPAMIRPKQPSVNKMPRPVGSRPSAVPKMSMNPSLNRRQGVISSRPPTIPKMTVGVGSRIKSVNNLNSESEPYFSQNNKVMPSSDPSSVPKNTVPPMVPGFSTREKPSLVETNKSIGFVVFVI